MPWLTPLYVAAVVAATVLELWLVRRQVAAVIRHRIAVPAPFAGSVSAEEHAKAADYTIAKARLARLTTVVDAAADAGPHPRRRHRLRSMPSGAAPAGRSPGSGLPSLAAWRS